MKLLTPLMVAMLIMLASCSSSNTSDCNMKKLTGRLFMTGNDPFASISLVVDSTTVYILDCNKETDKTLKEHQGERAEISYKNMRDMFGRKTLEVLSVSLETDGKK